MQPVWILSWFQRRSWSSQDREPKQIGSTPLSSPLLPTLRCLLCECCSSSSPSSLSSSLPCLCQSPCLCHSSCHQHPLCLHARPHSPFLSLFNVNVLVLVINNLPLFPRCSMPPPLTRKKSLSSSFPSLKINPFNVPNNIIIIIHLKINNIYYLMLFPKLPPPIFQLNQRFPQQTYCQNWSSVSS